MIISAARGRHAVNDGIGNAYIRKWNMSTYRLSKLVPSTSKTRRSSFVLLFFSGSTTVFEIYRICFGARESERVDFAFNLQKFSYSMGWRTRSRFFPRGVFPCFRFRRSKLVTVIYGITDVVHLWHGRKEKEGI